MKKIAVELRNQTVENLEYIKTVVGLSNETEALSYSIRMTRMLLDEMFKGNKVLIETDYGYDRLKIK